MWIHQQEAYGLFIHIFKKLFGCREFDSFHINSFFFSQPLIDICPAVPESVI